MFNEFDDVLVYLPKEKAFVIIAEGIGDNLLDEDIKNGYVDYIMYYTYDVKDVIADRFEVCYEDGGEILCKEYIQDKYNDLTEAIPYVLEFIYETKDIKYQILGRD